VIEASIGAPAALVAALTANVIIFALCGSLAAIAIRYRWWPAFGGLFVAVCGGILWLTVWSADFNSEDVNAIAAAAALVFYAAVFAVSGFSATGRNALRSA
jgi:hypothetical protein